MNTDRSAVLALVIALSWSASAAAKEAATPFDLSELSIDDLAKVDITSVSKRVEPLSDAAASIFVITRDDIVRSGAVTIPEMLRMAPNLLVSQETANSYNITARGFSGNAAAQNFPNKLLVLIDGRSVYSPLYSGVYWDTQFVLPEDIERIEVISGPGATLWGANAFNGVVNIITRASSDTHGGVIDVSGGNLGENASVQYGGQAAPDLGYRVYASGLGRNALEDSKGTSAHDGARSGQGGFRLDWSPGDDKVTVQGDLYRENEDQRGQAAGFLAGENFLGRWQHSLGDGSTVELQSYYDDVTRASPGNGAFTVRTFDIEAQHSLTLAGWNAIVWGGGERLNWYEINNTPTYLILPSGRRLSLSDGFIQDTMALTDALSFIAGLKVEDDPYSGVSPLPTGRLSWRLDERSVAWAAVSRAVRSPTPFDSDVVEYLGKTKFLTAGNFKNEDVAAYELGYRMQPARDFSFSVSSFFNHYNDLRTIEYGPTLIPLQTGNRMEGDTYGVEVWAGWKVADWWRLTAGAAFQHEDLRFRPGASKLLGLGQAGDDPKYHASVKSVVRLEDDLSWTADLRTIGAQPNPAVKAYTELNSQLAWAAAETLSFSLSGFNLLHDHHQELTATGNDRIGRGFTLAAQRRF